MEMERVRDRSTTLRTQIDDEQESSGLTPSSGSFPLLTILLGVVGVALLLAGFWLVAATTFEVGALLTVVGAVLATIAVFWLVRGRSSRGSAAPPAATRVRRQISEADEQLAAIQSRLQTESDALELGALDTDILLEAEGTLDAAEAKFREFQQLEAKLVHAIERAERQTLRRDEAQQSVQAAQATFEAEGQAWQTWLQERGLLSTFSPDSIQEMRTLVDLAKAHDRDVGAMEERIAAIQTDIDEFVGMCWPLAEAHGFEVSWTDYAKVAGTADDIIDLHSNVSEEARARTGVEKELEEAQHEFTERQKIQQAVANEINALLKSGKAEDAADFRRREKVFQQRGRPHRNHL